MKRIFAIALCVVAMASCQKSTPLTVSPDSITVYSEGTAQLSATPADGVTYSVKDDFYAKVDANGLVTGKKVGKTEVTVSSGNGLVNVPVTVLSKYTLYPELESLIGASTSKVTSVLGSNYKESTNSKGQKTYTYTNYNTFTFGIVVTFNGSTCSDIGVVISTTYLTQFVNYLKERYTVAGMQNDYYFFLDHDEKVVITMTLYNVNYMMAIYMPYTSSKAGEMDFSEIEETYRNLAIE